jgi:hypothetical protein
MPGQYRASAARRGRTGRAREGTAPAQVARRQPEGTWLRLLDQPELVRPAPPPA